MPESSASSESAASDRYAGTGRYRILGTLGRGGMGVIDRVLDTASGEVLALKRLQAEVAADRHFSLMLEREYHMLAGLSHPSIIHVHDFGVDERGPYYTMELLAGADMRELSPMPFRTACRHLRDVALSLALLHARRLMHRDVSPRNVRANAQGHVKLIDFGSTAAFGIPKGTTGTPPCVAPETLAGRYQDHRTDLYALGALAYYMLTGRHAYPARSLADLHEAWSLAPPPPSQVVGLSNGDHESQAIPPALDTLVLSLLHRDPLARPASAAEVIDRLEAIAGLPPQESTRTAQSYLRGTPLLGRSSEMERLRSRLRSAWRGRGGTVWIESASGMGRTRLLSELGVEAQLGGSLVLQADAELHPGPYGTVRALFSQLLSSAPHEARAAAAARAEILCHLVPDLEAHLGRAVHPAPVAEAPGEWRLTLHAALLSWLLEVARKRRLLLAIDNLGHADEGSMAWLAALSREARPAGVFLVTTIRSEQREHDSATLRAMAAIAEHIRLRPLSSESILELTRSLFGDAQHLPRLAERLAAASAGSPRHYIELVHHLISQEIVSFVDGAWMLPQTLPEALFEGGYESVLGGRIDAVSAEAQRLAESLAVSRGVVPIDLCLRLGEPNDATQTFAALDELVSGDLMIGVAGGYRFAQEAIRKGLLIRLEETRKQDLHRRVGHFLLASREVTAAHSPATVLPTRVEGAFHLLEAGEPESADLLAEAGLQLANGSDAMAEAVPALEAALRVYRETHRGPHALLSLLVPLTMAGYFVDRRLSVQYGEETVALLERVTGLALARGLEPFLGRRLSTFTGLGFGLLRHLLTPRSRIRHSFEELVTMLMTCVASQVSVAAICLDPWTAKRLLRVLEPLAALGTSHPVYAIYDFCRQARRTVQDQAPRAVRGMMRIYRRVVDEKRYAKLPDEAKDLLANGALYASGALKSLQDNGGALRHAELLEETGSPLYRMVAHQLRMVHHAYRGELPKAEAHRDKVELHAIQAGSAWQVEVWSPVTMAAVYMTTGDVIGLKRSIEQLEQVAREVPTVGRYLALARGGYKLLRGDAEGAVESFQQAVADARPREFIGWTTAMGFLAAGYNAQGRFERARQVALDTLSHLEDADYSFTGITLRTQIELSLSEAAIGETEQATARLEDLLRRHAPHKSPLTLGALHQARAQIALRCDDAKAFREHAELMGQYYRPTKHPSLVAQCEQLESEAVQAGLFEASRRPRRINPSAVILASADVTRSILRACKSPEERAERALHLLIERCDAAGGYLYLCSGHGPVLVAPRHGEEPWEELEQSVLATAERFSDEADTTAHDNTASLVPPPVGDSEKNFTSLVLGTNAPGTFTVVGIAALLHPERPITVPNYDMLEAVARTLYESGDITVSELIETH